MLRRMLEPEPPGVECLPMEPNGRGAVAHGGESHVLTLSQERMPAQRRLNADLVPFSRVQPDFDQRSASERLDDAIPADRFDTPGIAGIGLLLHQRRAIPGQVVTPCALCWRRVPGDHCEVHPLRLASNELLLERLLG